MERNPLLSRPDLFHSSKGLVNLGAAEFAKNAFSCLCARIKCHNEGKGPCLHLDALQSSSATFSANQGTLKDVCERCKDLNWCKAVLSIRGPFWPPKSPLSHKCGLSKALIKICEQSGTKGGMIRYIPHGSILGEITYGDRLAYFHIRLADRPPNGRPYSPACLDVKNCVLWQMPGERLISSRATISPNVANLDHARSWLTFCRHRHGKGCRRSSGDVLAGLKVIDCRSRQICIARANEPYAALSYLWGKQRTSEIYATADLPTSFPKTIEDALTVCRELGVPYLWVDRYCIDQYNHKERHHMIANMDKIYAQSDFTIIAAAGSDPHHGLPGVSATPRNGTYRVSLREGYLDYFADPVQEVRQSKWSQRAWTYQEMLLSPRRLVFTESQMLFECSTQDFRESVNLPCRDHAVSEADLNTTLMVSTHKALRMSRSPCHVFPKQGLGTEPEDIYARILDFSGKKLSYPSDKLNAMDGIFSAFRRSVPGYLHHFWGIPIMENELVSFFEGLCWYSLMYQQDTVQEQWPTWSWASARDRITIQERVAKSESIGTSVTITRLSGQKEDLCQFARGARDYRDYHPWFEISTWVSICPHVDEYLMDEHKGSQGKDDPKGRCIAVYLFENWFQGRYFLLVEDAEDGSFRRVGLAKRWKRHEEDWSMTEVGGFRTVRIV